MRRMNKGNASLFPEEDLNNWVSVTDFLSTNEIEKRLHETYTDTGLYKILHLIYTCF